MNKTLGIKWTQLGIAVAVGLAVVVGLLALLRLDITGQSGSGLSEEYSYDVEDLAKIDPNLILYEESSAPISTGFQQARSITARSGRIYVAGDMSVREFSTDGKLLSEIVFSDMPRCLAITDSAIYVAMKDHVEKYDHQGDRLASWQSLGSEAVLTSIAVSKDDVFVADAGNRVVLRYDRTGELINRIGEKDEARNIPGFVVPSPYFDLAVAGDGLLRVTNPGRHHIEAYTFNGDREFWWGEFSSSPEGFCGCCNPVSFAMLDDDSYVTCEKGLIRVKVYDPDGVFVGVVAGPEQLAPGGVSHVCLDPVQCQTGGFDVAVGADGRVFVLDTISNVVRVFTRIQEQ
jgi:hypothetical protein